MLGRFNPFFLFFVAAFLVIYGGYYFFKSSKELPIIAVTQIIEHETLDTVREGMMARLKERGCEDGKNVRILYQNAYGQLTTAAQIVQNFANAKPKVLVALSTQSAQLLCGMSQQQHVPLIFSAVTDPVAAKLVSQMETRTPGITGISDYMSPEPQIAMMKAFFPHLRTLGVLYNPSEVNSAVYLQTFERAVVASNIALIKSPLNNTSEAVAATKKLIGSVDAIYFPNDNTAMAAVSAIVGVAHAQGVPVFANDSASVERGALAAVAYDRTQMGYDTADLVIEALEQGFSLAKPVRVGSNTLTVVSQEALSKLMLTVPKELVSAVTIKN